MLNAKAESKSYGLITTSDVSYSTTEHDTGLTWIDGKKIYATTKEWDNQALSNSTKLNHDISSIDKVIDYNAIYCDGINYIKFPITGASNDKTVGLRVSPTQVILTGTDSYSASSGRNLYVTIYYTKTI